MCSRQKFFLYLIGIFSVYLGFFLDENSSGGGKIDHDYILPFIIYYFYRNKKMLWGLLLGNLIDLDHVYYRIIGKVEWFGSACQELGMQCSLGFYPLHTYPALIVFLLVFP